LPKTLGGGGDCGGYDGEGKNNYELKIKNYEWRDFWGGAGNNRVVSKRGGSIQLPRPLGRGGRFSKMGFSPNNYSAKADGMRPHFYFGLKPISFLPANGVVATNRLKKTPPAALKARNISAQGKAHALSCRHPG
jgi:hypothetical protein